MSSERENHADSPNALWSIRTHFEHIDSNTSIECDFRELEAERSTEFGDFNRWVLKVIVAVHQAIPVRIKKPELQDTFQGRGFEDDVLRSFEESPRKSRRSSEEKILRLEQDISSKKPRKRSFEEVCVVFLETI